MRSKNDIVKRVLTFVFGSAGVLLVLSYLLVGMTAFQFNEQELKCRDMFVEIEGTVPLLEEEEINETLREAGLHPIGMSFSDLQSERIERLLETHPGVKKALCYRTPAGRVYITVQLRNPVMLVMGAESYYVDEDRVVVPVPLQAAAYVPLVTGRVTRSRATGELFDFVKYLSNDPFWNAQTTQLHVRNDLKVELVPRVGEAVILLGSLTRYKEKLDRVYRLYENGFNVMGWNAYDQLDVQFENQIIGRKTKK